MNKGSFWLLSFIWLSWSAGALFAENPNKNAPHSIKISEIPQGSVLVIYGPIERDEYLKKAVSESGSWLALLKKLGVSFPKGGFAFFDERLSSLFVATSNDQQALIVTLLSH